MSNDDDKKGHVFLLASAHPTRQDAFAPICYGWCFDYDTTTSPEKELMIRMYWLALRWNIRPADTPQGQTMLPQWEFPPPAIVWDLKSKEFHGFKPFYQAELADLSQNLRIIWLQVPDKENIKIVDEGPPKEKSRIVVPKLHVPNDIIDGRG